MKFFVNLFSELSLKLLSVPKNYFLAFATVFILVSCSKREMKIPSTFKVQKTDFQNTLTISGYVESLNSYTVVCPSQFEGTVVSIVEDGSHVKKGDIVCVLESQSVLDDYDQIATQLKNAEMDFEKLKANQAMQLALMEAQVKTNQAESEIASLDSLQQEFNSPVQRKIKELELQQNLIQKQRLQKKKASLEIIQNSEIRRKELQIDRFKSRLESAQKRIDELTLVAPVDGLVILSVNRRTGKKIVAGDLVWSNMPVVHLPVSDKMKVKIDAPEASFKRINEGDTVEYLFDAMPENKAQGVITKKSPVGRPVVRDSKVKIFEIEASVDSYKTLPESGFTCNCKVILKKVDDVIVVPQIAVFDSDSMKVVYVIHRGFFEKRQVITGLSSPERIIIIKGLNKGEVVTLTEPEKEFVKKVTVFHKTKTEQSISKKYE